MSLEEALNRNSDLLEKHNALLTKVLAGGKTAPDAKPETAKESKSAAATKPKAAPAGKKTPSVAVISERFANYMKAGDDDEREQAKANVRALVKHHDAPKLTEIDPQHFPRLLEYLDAWEAGSEVEFDEVTGSDEGDDNGSALL